MAQTAFTPILLYSSSTASAAPAVGNLTNSTLGSELAINITDGKLFFKDNTNAIQVIGWKVVPTTAGGTGLISYSQGDLLYYNSGTTLIALTKSTTATRYLSNTGSNNNPAWAQIDLSNGVTGTLPVGNGGTGTATVFTAGSVIFAGASGVYSQDNASLFFDNTNDRLGIGTTTPNQKLQVTGSNNTGFAGATLQNSNASSGLAGVQFSSDTTYSKSAIAQVRENANGVGSLVFYVDSVTDAADWSAGDEKMRIDAVGNLLVGTGTVIQSGMLSVAGAICSQTASAGFSANLTTSSGDQFYFRTNSGANLAGYITCPTASTTSYLSVSDYRLKENVTPMTGALAKVAQLNPCTYTWKTDGLQGQGFIAHELQSVVPGCVVGKKDAVDNEGKPKYQGVDTSFLVATLVAAIQEQQALITQLQADVYALKGS